MIWFECFNCINFSLTYHENGTIYKKKEKWDEASSSWKNPDTDTLVGSSVKDERTYSKEKVVDYVQDLVFHAIDVNGKLIKGKVGKDLTTDEAYKAAERCGISIISQVKKACEGDLSKVKSCIKLTGFVNSTDDYTEQPKVINGASDTIAKIFGDAGMHTRAAVSTNSLPLGVAVEVDAIFELN